MKRNMSCSRLSGLLSIVLFMLSLSWGCKKAPIVYSTTDAVNITGYLDKYPDQFSEFREMLEITGFNGFLSVYGHYTLFLPTNDAVNSYLKKMNKPSVKDIDVQTLKDLVKFHILQDTLYTISFTDGKLPTLTMYGQYLVTGVTNTDGKSSITVNRQASITQSNIRVGNGVIHVIDHVLEPAKLTLAQLIEKNPDYSIFTQALKATGFYDTLNILPADNPDSARAWLTVLAQSDSVLHAAGFNSYAELKAKYSNTGNPKEVNDSLHLFVAYHIIYGADYLADIISSSSFSTLAPQQVVTTKLINDSVLINDDIFNGVHEQGILLDRAGSDISATNGVLHDATGHLFIKVRVPFPVYWDVCRYSEIMNLPSYYGKQEYVYSIDNLPSFITDPGPAAPSYEVNNTDPFVYGDYLKIPLGARRSPWIELKTPLLVRGKYKVWICYRRAGRSRVEQVSIDGVPLQRTMNKATYPPHGTDAELEAQGWKFYTDDISNNNWTGYLVGTIDIQTTSQHSIRFTNLQGTDNDFWLDMIEFIPVDMDQLWPRFKADGTPVYKP